MEAAFGVHTSFVGGLLSITSREAASRSFSRSHRASSMGAAEPLMIRQLTLGLRISNHSSAQGDKPRKTARTIILLTLRSLETGWVSRLNTRPSDFRWADSDRTTAWGRIWATVGK